MDNPAVSSAGWTLTEKGFAGFLACLDADPQRAGEKYESVRLTLLKFFDWRGARFPEECADETINRVIRKIEEGETIRDIQTYCHGVARLVFLETLKRAENRRADLEEVDPQELVAPEPEEEDPRQACFNHCLGELPQESQQLIMQYYQDEKRAKINNRQSLAERLGLPLNALRSRAQRIRNRLEECVSRCLKKE